MSDKLIKLNDQFLHVECSQGIATIAIGNIIDVWGGTNRKNDVVTKIWLIGRPPIEVRMRHSDVEAIIAGPPDPRQQIVAFVNGKPQTQPVLNYGPGELIVAEPEELDELDELNPFFQFAQNVEEHLSRRGEATGTEETICDDMTVADAIAVLQKFSLQDHLVLQVVLPSGEVHGLPLKVFQPRPGAAVGMTMRCHPNSTVETFGGKIPVQSNRGSND